MNLHAAPAATTLALALALSSAGCTETCDRSAEANPPVRYTEGTVAGDVYTTAPPDGELLHFPGGMRYQLVHGLGRRPDWWTFELSFSRTGTSGGELAPAAGSEAIVLGVDATTITVANDTCVEFWMRGVVGAGDAGGGGGGGDAGGGG